jgi:hypothetical protein
MHNTGVVIMSDTRKIVINSCFGGFGVTRAVYDELEIKWDGFGYVCGHMECKRDDPALIAAIEAVGVEKASGRHANLKIVEIPADVEWEIDEYDGFETVHEKHRSWS